MIYRLGMCTIAPLMLVLTLIAVGIGPPFGHGGKNTAQEAKTTSLIDSLGKNEHLAELLWIHCRQELMYANEVIEDIHFGFLEEKTSHKNDIFGRFLFESESSMVSKVDNALLDCLRKKNLLFLLYEEQNGPKNQLILYMDVIYARRSLIQSVGVSPAPSPASSGIEFPRSDNRANPPLFPGSLSDSTSQLAFEDETFSGVEESHKEKGAYSTVVNAVIVTAVATFIVSALLFLCYHRFFSRSGQGQNDVRPLLSLSLSDHSVASSRKSFTLNSSSNRENPSDEGVGINSNCNAKMGDFCLRSCSVDDLKISDPVGICSGTDLKSVDNVTVPNSDMFGLLPLKPPPGRSISSIPTLVLGNTPAAPPPLASPPPPPLPPPLRPSFRDTRPPAPPPPLVGVVTPSRTRPPYIGSNNPSTSTQIEGDEAPKAKLKPFFWDKVLANPDHSMVWHQINSGSFHFNEEMIETLFGYTNANANANAGKTKRPQKESSSFQDSSNYIQIIDHKKSQNLSILLKGLNVTTEEVRDALQEGNELPSELIQSLLKMAPTSDEEQRLRLYNGDLSRLGPAERFLKVLVGVPSAFKRLESLLFMCTLQEEEKIVKESFSTLEGACMELGKSRLFIKLLEAVLKTGNRMNVGTYRGGAQAFKLDTLLKLSDVKGVDGKTTLLHFVVQEIIRSEGVRKASTIISQNLPENDTSYDTEEDYYQSIGLQMVSGLGDELENVKKAAVLDLNSVNGTVSKLADALVKARENLNLEMRNVDEESGFYQSLRSFVQNAEVDIRWLLEEEKRIMVLVKNTGEYFHGSSSAKDEGLRIFVIVRDFLVNLDRVCTELESYTRNQTKYKKKYNTDTDTKKYNTNTDTTIHSTAQQSLPFGTHDRICTLVKNRRLDDSSS